MTPPNTSYGAVSARILEEYVSRFGSLGIPLLSIMEECHKAFGLPMSTSSITTLEQLVLSGNPKLVAEDLSFPLTLSSGIPALMTRLSETKPTSEEPLWVGALFPSSRSLRRELFTTTSSLRPRVKFEPVTGCLEVALETPSKDGKQI